MIIIPELKPNENIQAHFLVRKVKDDTTKNGKRYLNVNLGNSTGVLEGCKVWDRTEEDLQKFVEGQFVYVEGTTNEYQGQIQLVVQRSDFPREQVELHDYVQYAPMKEAEARTIIEGAIREMEHDEIRELTLAIYKAFEKQFYQHAAAQSMHHDVPGGLAYHTATMLQVAQQLLHVYPFLKRDLLCAGVILHDMAKVIELDNPMAPTYSKEGRLRGHIAMMDTFVQRMGKVLISKNKMREDSDVPMVLSHLILSHHGQKEWGSPVEPLMPEAQILHMIDNIDAKLYMIRAHQQTANPGEFYHVKQLRRDFYEPSL